MSPKNKKSKAPGWCVSKFCGHKSTKTSLRRHRFGKNPGIASKK